MKRQKIYKLSFAAAVLATVIGCGSPQESDLSDAKGAYGQKIDRCCAEGSNIVEFHIPAGTRGRAWNTEQSMLTLQVGDVLRVYNDDTVTHAIHTDGAPFPHGDTIDPGTFRDHLVAGPFEPNANVFLYDHDWGLRAKIWLRAVARSKDARQALALEPVFEQSGIHMFLPDAPALSEYPFQVSDDSVIADIAIHLNITHTYIGDLTLSLQAPDGTIARLQANVGGGNDNLDAVFGTGGLPAPELMNIIGKDVSGTWKVLSRDDAGADTGFLESIQLLIVKA